METKKRRINTKLLSRVAIFSAIATILYVIEVFSFPLPMLFPGFLKFHFDEIPAFIAGFAFGPLEAFLILVVKTIIKLPLTETATIGEFADLIYSCAFILPSAILYKKRKDFKTAITSVLIGMVIQLIVSALCNAFFMIELYAYFYGISVEKILSMCQAVNPKITDIRVTLTIYAIIPFNLLKDIAVAGIVFIIYKRLSPVFKRMQ